MRVIACVQPLFLFSRSACKPPPSDPCVHCVDDYVRCCAEIQSPPRVRELAERFRFDASRLNKRFHRRYGLCLSTYVKHEQVVLADELMRATNWTTATIAYRSGFGTRRTFFRAYRRLQGETPASYRARVV
jgi:AraC-like DNA-binding protein